MTFPSWLRTATHDSAHKPKKVRTAVPVRHRLPGLGLECLEDRRLFSATFTVLNADDSGVGSLRQAILDANASPNVDGPDLIHFKLPGEGVQTLNVGSAGLGSLPSISEPVTIDGYSQPGASANRSR